MPLHTDAERRWAYYVPQPIPEDAVAQAPETVRDLKLLDPAVGSGHFLVVALDLLVALYREEARHRGEAGEERWSDRAIVERILSHNLHGIDLDPRAVQIAAAALWLKARQVAADARPERLNLVASNLRLASLADDDPALVELRREVERETGIPAALTDTLIHALRGADHLGSLLKVDTAVDEALERHEAVLGRAIAEQGDLFDRLQPQPERSRHRPRRGQGHPARPAGGLSRAAHRRRRPRPASARRAARGRRALRAAGARGHLRPGGGEPAVPGHEQDDGREVHRADIPARQGRPVRGVPAARAGAGARRRRRRRMLTMRNWMFIKQYAELRRASTGDTTGCARSVTSTVAPSRRCRTTAQRRGVSVFAGRLSQGIEPAALVRRPETTRSRRSRANRAQARRHPLPRRPPRLRPSRAEGRAGVAACVLVGSATSLTGTAVAPSWRDVAPVRNGLTTGDNARFLRRQWEVSPSRLHLANGCPGPLPRRATWAPYIKGPEGTSVVRARLATWSQLARVSAWK